MVDNNEKRTANEALEDLELILEVSRRLEKNTEDHLSLAELKKIFPDEVFIDNPYAGLSAEELFD